MIITNCTVGKVDKNDPRYPDANAVKRKDGSLIPFSDVYLCQCTMDDGSGYESPFFVYIESGDMTPSRMGIILESFGRAVSRLDEKAAAA